MPNDIFARCMAISMSHFLNIPYKEQTITEMYAPDGFANTCSFSTENDSLSMWNCYWRKNVVVIFLKRDNSNEVIY